MLCVCVADVMDVVFSVCIVHPVAVLNSTFCMTCSLLTMVKDGRGILQRVSLCVPDCT